MATKPTVLILNNIKNEPELAHTWAYIEISLGRSRAMLQSSRWADALVDEHASIQPGVGH